ncbi:MAG: hypothetical protein PHO07_19530 [Pirellulales bacterium]|jgi:hypothetical protein|nr:hypothetical protein [Thermoguttaceae bacterium]MDD4789367.1 hypothetical protein [Pirellulales bacterium]MDI9445698.1 hypothetical protein [Planctomycetota bacterium]NLZ02395.1 hypothetical protein [Pirellulaceae bacterium]
MAAAKGQHVFLTGAFVATIFGVGLLQSGIEVSRGQRPRAADLFLKKPTEANLRAYERNLEEASWFAEKVRPTVQYARFALLGDAGPKTILGRDGWLFYRPGVRYLIEPWPPQAGCGVGQGDPVPAILDFRDQLDGRGIELLVVPVPGKASVYPEMLTERAPAPGQPLAGHTRKIIAQLEEAGVAVVDLFEVFERAKRGEEAGGKTEYYLRQDTHWSPEGMRLAAQATARKLLELGRVERGQVQYDLKPIAVERRGDIVRMMQAPRIERCFPAETIDCTQVVHRQSGEVYCDDPDAEILVLGDSFLRIYEQDAPGSGGMIAHLARELGAPLASLVNDGGASTLVRQALARKPALLANKKVVVWELIERDIRFGIEGWRKVPLPAERQAGIAAAMLE